MLYSSGTTGRPKGIKPSLPERQVDQPGDLFVRSNALSNRSWTGYV
jgi:fatty-acyl-CoA synthase